MADIEQKRILTIDVQKSLMSLRDLRQELAKNKSALDKMTGSEANYEEQLVKTKRLQTEYNAAMRVAVKESKAAAGSYDYLTVQLAKLKKQWKATGDEAERARLTKQVNAVKEQLNAMDHSIGNWQRNVGNYWNSLKGGFMGVTAAIAAGLAVFRTLSGILKSTQGTGDELKTNVAGWTATWDFFKRSVASTDFTGFVQGAAAAAAAGRNLAQVLDELFERANSLTLQRAKASKQMAEWERTFRDTTLGDAERLEALNLYIAKLEEFQTQETDSLQRERDARLGVLAAQAKVSKADQEAFAQNIENYNINEALIKQARQYISIQGSITALEKQNWGQAEDRRREQIATLKEQAAMFTSAEVAYADFVTAYDLTDDQLVKDFVDAQKRLYESAAAVYNENTRLFTLRDKLRGAEITADDTATEKAVENAKKREAARQAELDAFIKGVDDAAQAEVDASFKAEAAANRARNGRNAGTLGAVDRWAAGAGVSARAEIDDERTLQARLYEIRKTANEKKLELLRRFAQEAKDAQDLQGQIAYEQQAADIAVQITQEEVTEKARLRRQEQADIRATTKAAIDATTQMLGNVASAYQASIDARVQSGKISEKQAAKEYEQVKALQLAQTWINALAGSIAVWSNSDPSPYWVKAAQSAAILTQGIAATAQIKATQRGSSTGNAFAAVQAAPVVINAPGQVRTVTSASDEARLNERSGTQRVVLVYSDVQAMAKKVQVTEAESQF